MGVCLAVSVSLIPVGLVLLAVMVELLHMSRYQ